MHQLIERAKRTMESKHAVASIGAVLAFGLAWGALLWIWYNRNFMAAQDDPADTPEEKRARAMNQQIVAKNLQGPLWLAIAGALAGFIMLIVASALPSARELAGKVARYSADTKRSVFAKIHEATAPPS